MAPEDTGPAGAGSSAPTPAFQNQNLAMQQVSDRRQVLSSPLLLHLAQE